MRTGQFRYRINIYDLQKVANEYGEPDLNLKLHKTAKASRKFIGGLMTLQDNQVAPKQTVEFTVRYDPTLAEDMVVIYKGEKYRITYVFHTFEITTTMRSILSKDENLGEPIVT